MKDDTENKPRGRPELPPKDRRVLLSVRVDPMTYRAVAGTSRDLNISMGKVIDILSQEYLARDG